MEMKQMNEVQKDVFVFVAKDYSEYGQYTLPGGWEADNDTWKFKNFTDFHIFVTWFQNEAVRTAIAEHPENYADVSRIKAFLDAVLWEFKGRIFPYRHLFVCTHWGASEGGRDEVVRRETLMQGAYDALAVTDDLKQNYPRCFFISLSKGCDVHNPKPADFFGNEEIIIPDTLDKLYRKLVPARLKQNGDLGSGQSAAAASASSPDETEHERCLRELQEPFSKLEALAILCQGIDASIKAKIDVSSKFHTRGNPDVLRWWQCGDSEIANVFSPTSKIIKVGIQLPEILSQMHQALTGQSDFPDTFDFAAASNALLQIKQELYKKIVEES